METQAGHTDNACSGVSERTSNEFPLPGEDGAHVPIEVEESKVKHDQSYAKQPPPYKVFPLFEDDNSPPPLYEVEVVLTITSENDRTSVVGNENCDDSNDGDDDDVKDDEDLDLHWLLGEEKFTESEE